MYELKILLQTVLLPPVNCFVLALIGVWLRSRRVGRMLIWATGMLFIVSSLPVVGLTLMDAGSRRMAISDDAVAASQAIVLLPGGLYANAAEYNGRDVASNNTFLLGQKGPAEMHRVVYGPSNGGPSPTLCIHNAQGGEVTPPMLIGW